MVLVQLNPDDEAHAWQYSLHLKLRLLERCPALTPWTPVTADVAHKNIMLRFFLTRKKHVLSRFIRVADTLPGCHEIFLEQHHETDTFAGVCTIEFKLTDGLVPGQRSQLVEAIRAWCEQLSGSPFSAAAVFPGKHFMIEPEVEVSFASITVPHGILLDMRRLARLAVRGRTATDGLIARERGTPQRLLRLAARAVHVRAAVTALEQELTHTSRASAAAVQEALAAVLQSVLTSGIAYRRTLATLQALAGPF